MLPICLTDLLRRCPLTGYPLSRRSARRKLSKTILIFSLFKSSGVRWYPQQAFPECFSRRAVFPSQFYGGLIDFQVLSAHLQHS